MTEDDHRFLMYVQSYVQKRPEVAGYIGTYIAAGIQEYKEELLEVNRNLESALLASLMGKFKGATDLILGKIKDIQNNRFTYFNWTSFLEEHERKKSV
jgi:hypothetical protein